MFSLQPSQIRLLNSLNPLFVSGFVLFSILIRTTCEPWAPQWVRQWDLLLPFIVYFGQRRSLAEGLILALFTSHLYSLSSAAPIGLFTTAYLGIFVVARLLSYVIYANTWLSVLWLITALSVLARVLLTVVATAFGHGWPLLSFDNFVWWGLLFNGLAGSFYYVLIETIDRMTFKVPRINLEMAETGA